ncbi:MAG: putative LPS assembly protein LptD [Bacteroidales bacterium]|nr:putative LPS assembly protein LptD [Bacteroidales bacterium]
MTAPKKIFSFYFTALVLLLVFGLPAEGSGQEAVPLRPPSDTSNHALLRDSLHIAADTLLQAKATPQKNAFGLEDVVECRSVDSLIFDIRSQMVYMYEGAEIDYQTTHLKANYVQIDFAKSIAFARGVPDSTGKVTGTPEFTEGELSFNANEMHYNYKTEQGIIKDVKTQEGEGFLHGDVVKKLDDNTSNMGEGWYTTCNADHPHFALHYKRARVIPDDKVVTGLAWIEIEDVPLPIGLPFGLFPLTKGATSGIVIPRYGEQANRGYFLENGGYYWHINDYFDLKVLGDIYTRGSWAIKPSLRYKLRYRYSGNFSFSYALNKVGQPNTPSYQESTDFRIRWSHQQDPKARPNSTFSANVNIVSNNFNKYTPSSTRDYLSNTYSSSVSYQANLFQNRANLTLNSGLTQNTSTRSLKVTLPSMTLNVNRFYPLKRRNPIGKKRWYEDISVQYNMVAENSLNTIDSVLLMNYENGTLLQQFNNGMRHTVSAQSPIRILKYLNMTNSVSYTDRWYLQHVEQSWNSDTLFNGNDTLVGYVQTDTIPGFISGRDYSVSSSISTKIYGMVAFKKSPLRAIRHVVTPSVSFSYRPDFGKEQYGYYKTYYNPDADQMVTYSVFNAGGYSSVYGGVSTGESGRVNFKIDNNLEIKIRDKNDTLTGTKKVKIIDNLSLSTSYDIARDSLNWDPLSLSGRTKLFNLININYSARFNPYYVDSLGRSINTFQYSVNKRLFRKENMSLRFSMSYSISSSKLNSSRKAKQSKNPSPDISASPYGTEEEKLEVLENPEMYLDWNNSWNLSLSYNLNLGNTYRYTDYEVTEIPNYVHTMNLRGDINITPKWKLGFNTNYDLQTFELSYTQLNIYRDLHCWEMRFNWTPLGTQKGWNFTLNAKSQLLQDLKLTKKKDFRDY